MSEKFKIIMGLDITFFKTKRSNFRNGEVGIWDEEGNNKYGDKGIYYLRGCKDMRDYLQSLDKTEPYEWINGKVIELDYNTISKLSSFLPIYYEQRDIDNFIDVLSEPLNRGYIVYVECNW